MRAGDAAVIATGFVKPPADFGPAIEALSLEARAKMSEFEAAGIPKDRSIALAADWQNQLRSRTA